MKDIIKMSETIYNSEYDRIYDRILENKDNIIELENIFTELEERKDNIDFRIRLQKILKFLDEEYTFNRIFYYIIKKLLYNLNFDLIKKILLVYNLKLTDIDKLINEIKVQEDELSFKNFKHKKLSDKQIIIIQFLENRKIL